MKIALINGSPKVRSSASGILLEDLKAYLGETEVMEFGFHTGAVTEEEVEALNQADVFVFSFPLYVDGIPGHLLSCLAGLEEASFKNREIRVYGIVNCGFFEGIQAETALQVLENWCAKAGYVWESGVGVGGGGALAQMPKTKSGHGPREPVEKALKVLANAICARQTPENQQTQEIQRTQENQYVSVAFPRFLYKLAAQTGWRQMMKANGGKARDLGKRPGISKE